MGKISSEEKNSWPLKPVTNKAMAVLQKHDLLKQMSKEEYAIRMYGLAADAAAVEEICGSCFDIKVDNIDELDLAGFANAVQNFLSKFLAG